MCTLQSCLGGHLYLISLGADIIQSLMFLKREPKNGAIDQRLRQLAEKENLSVSNHVIQGKSACSSDLNRIDH